VLHLTNGDCAVPPLRAAGVEGELLPWREVLHDGPVPGHLSRAELRELRGRFLGGEEPHLRAQEDRLDRAIGAREEIMLWFEADLFDVLLLVQILERVPRGAPVRLVLVGQERWTSVTEVEPARLAELARDAPPVGEAQLALARTAWEAFTSETPLALEPLAAGTPELPAIGQAAARLLEELPWVRTGLTRTERQLLEPLANGARTREEAFLAAVAAEERPFLGDLSAWRLLDRLAPLLDGRRVNARGRAVLAGEERWIPQTERWLGGTRIPPGPPPWEWDPDTARVRTVLL
jgi:hypothetical protein